LALLAGAVVALYVFHLAGPWRWVYIVGATAALYLNVFVGVVQAFQKLPFLQPLAPTQSEPPFIVAQLLLLVAFVALGALAVVQRSGPRLETELPAGPTLKSAEPRSATKLLLQQVRFATS